MSYAYNATTEEDIYEAISLKTCVEKRTTIGAPGESSMLKVLEINEKYLNDTKID